MDYDLLAALQADLGLDNVFSGFDLSSAKPIIGDNRSLLGPHALPDGLGQLYAPREVDLATCSSAAADAVVPRGYIAHLSKPLLLPYGSEMLVAVAAQAPHEQMASLPRLAVVGTTDSGTGTPTAIVQRVIDLGMSTVTDIKLLPGAHNKGTAIVAGGERVHLVSFSAAAAAAAAAGGSAAAAADALPLIGCSAGDIREVAVSVAGVVAFGGYSEQIHMVLLPASGGGCGGGGGGGAAFPAQPPVPAGGVVSSVRWDPRSDGTILSWTTERGGLYFLDTRSSGGSSGSGGGSGGGGGRAAAPRWACGRDTYSHAYHGDNVVIVVGAGGAIDVLDRRMFKDRSSRTVASLCDPLLQDIGDVEVHETTGKVVMTGISGVSVWDISLAANGALHAFLGGYVDSAAATADSARDDMDDDGSSGSGGGASGGAAQYRGCMLADSEQPFYACVSTGSSVVKLFTL
ncbi:hypothetical protein JKP88DRAFT_254656 [Tribonema minus]|uniref:Uncharacterized protein n=1 Tax=Tribonema minus TaxID=303371 RepID=A0A835Z1R3_9STRA|nr:hypothetical protein JKP88DRAFT_254656 [Tribonema minus]